MPKTAVTFHPGPLRGSVGVPGDKSISHRALIVGARCRTPLRVANLNPGSDVLATRKSFEALGAAIGSDGDDVVVSGDAASQPGNDAGLHEFGLDGSHAARGLRRGERSRAVRWGRFASTAADGAGRGSTASLRREN